MRLSHWFLISCSFTAGVASAFGLAAVFPLSPKVVPNPIVVSPVVSPIVDAKMDIPADTSAARKMIENGMKYPVLSSENEKYGRNIATDVDVSRDGTTATTVVKPNILYFGVDHYPLSPATLRMLQQHKTAANGGDFTGNDDMAPDDIRFTARLSDSPLNRVRQYQISRPIEWGVSEVLSEAVSNTSTDVVPKNDAVSTLSPSPASASYFRKR